MNMPTMGMGENANKLLFPQKSAAKAPPPPCDVLSHVLTGEHLFRQNAIAGELMLLAEYRGR